MNLKRLWKLQNRLAPYFFLAPFVGLFALFFCWPLARSLYLSFCSTDGPRHVRFTGLRNYAYLFHDIVFWGALLNTAVYVIAFLLVQIPLSLFLAVQLNHPNVAGRNILRFAFFSTSLVGPVFVAVIFCRLLNPSHLTRHVPWLTNPILAHGAVLIAWLWLSVGFAMIYLLAALQGVDLALYEAAAIDGAKPWARFWHVTLPGIWPVLTFLVLVGAISGFQLFELPYVLLQGPGPGYAGFTVVMYLFQIGFMQGNLGYASTVGWVLVIITALIALARWPGRQR